MLLIEYLLIFLIILELFSVVNAMQQDEYSFN